jgi:hypothetical protein
MTAHPTLQVAAHREPVDYHVEYRRKDSATRTYRITVLARDADEARAYAAIKDPAFGSTVRSPRRGKRPEPPESADPLTAAKVLAEIARMG